MSINLSKITTEQRNQNTSNIDQLSTENILKVLNHEDQQVPLAVSKAIPQMAPLVDMIVKAFQQGGRLIYVGSGTSGRLGVLDASECKPTYSIPDGMVLGIIAGGDKALRNSIENAEDNKEAAVKDLDFYNICNKDVIIGITASGRTPYPIGAVEYGKSLGCITGCITTSENSEIASKVDYPIEAITGSEPITGSTRMKSGTAQKLILNMLSTTCMIKLGKVYDNLMVDVLPLNKKLIIRSQNIISTITGVSTVEAQEAMNKYKTVKKSVFALITGETNINVIDQCLNNNYGHLKNSIQDYMSSQ
ncbi:hypothetical protein WA158_005102 [Blastocystis sp. Blastoise]